jgi:membrane protease YdiL (CAAX protease family)
VVVLIALFAAGVSVSENMFVAVAGTAIYSSFLAGLWLVVVRRRKLSWSDVGFRPVGGGALLAMIPAAIGLIFLNALVVLATRSIVGDVPTAREQVLGDQLSMSGGEFAALLLLAAVVAPFVEELVFRGLLYRYMRARRGAVVAAIGSAIAFALAHLVPVLFLALFVIGFVLARVAERYDSLIPPITLHGLHNGTAILLLFVTLN